MLKIGSLQGRTSDKNEDWRNFGDPQKVGKVLKWGVRLIIHYLLTDFSLKQTKKF